MDHIEFLVSQDETELALKCFDMVPAYDRDFKNKNLEHLKSQILGRILMPIDLLGDPREIPKTNEHSIHFLNGTKRGVLLKTKVEEANEKGIVPHLVDFGPGDFTFAVALHALEYKFTYFPISFNLEATTSAANILGDKFKTHDFISHNTWFIAYEIIEHLPQIGDMRSIFERCGLAPKKVFFSTPKYTFEAGTPNWREDGIHHLRAYTPTEFINALVHMFPNYKMHFVDDPVMCLWGELHVIGEIKGILK